MQASTIATIAKLAASIIVKACAASVSGLRAEPTVGEDGVDGFGGSWAHGAKVCHRRGGRIRAQPGEIRAAPVRPAIVRKVADCADVADAWKGSEIALQDSRESI